MTAPLGRFALVLHTHLPWVAHHGTWPVGEEWLHQAWATSYQPLFAMLRRRAALGHRRQLTLGVTPIVAAQWDDTCMIGAHHTWLGYWQARAAGMATAPETVRKHVGQREYAEASRALTDFDAHWSAGGSAALRPLVDAGVIEMLGGPLTHTFTPLVPDRLALASMAEGLQDSVRRIGTRPRGAWTPECAWEPGMEELFAQSGVEHVVLDGPSLLGAGATTSAAWLLGDSNVRVLGRDLEVTYRVWSPKRGYPGDRWYRDFHTFDHEWGFRPARVTGQHVEPHDKAPYDPLAARARVEHDARDFVEVVRQRLLALAADPTTIGSPHVVVAFDTELFGHWWHEGPAWLERVLELMPEAGIDIATLDDLTADPVGRVHPGPGSWGLGKDWHIWTGPQDIADLQGSLAKEALAALDTTHPRVERSLPHDQLVRELLLALSSDWAFMVSHDTAAEYARGRFDTHARATSALAAALREGRRDDAARHAARAAERDHPFGSLDSRSFLNDASLA
jgi:1,4-alpha-glucan branching enzyme